jgi:hypothetical protein
LEERRSGLSNQRRDILIVMGGDEILDDTGRLAGGRKRLVDQAGGFG